MELKLLVSTPYGDRKGALVSIENVRGSWRRFCKFQNIGISVFESSSLHGRRGEGKVRRRQAHRVFLSPLPRQ